MENIDLLLVHIKQEGAGKMKLSKSFLIKCVKHQINVIKENLAKGLKSLKFYILNLIELEEKLANLTKEPVYIFADDCGEFTRENTINGGEQLVLPFDNGSTHKVSIENEMIARLKAINFSAKIWEKGEKRRLYIVCWSHRNGRIGYVDLVTLKYHGESIKRLCDMVREALASLGVS